MVVSTHNCGLLASVRLAKATHPLVCVRFVVYCTQQVLPTEPVMLSPAYNCTPSPKFVCPITPASVIHSAAPAHTHHRRRPHRSGPATSLPESHSAGPSASPAVRPGSSPSPLQRALTLAQFGDTENCLFTN